MRKTLDAKYKNANLNEVMTKQRQQQLTDTERHKLLYILKKFEDLFDGMLGTWNTTPVDLELKDDVKPVCLRPYTLLKLHKTMPKKEVQETHQLGNLLLSK